jgi:hypothetical protein
LDNDEDNHPPPEENNDPELTVNDDLTLANLEGAEPEDSKDSYTSDLCRQSLAKVSFFFFNLSNYLFKHLSSNSDAQSIKILVLTFGSSFELP